MYGSDVSAASTLPVVATLAEAGLPYEVVVVNVMEGAHLKPEFKAMNPVRVGDDGGGGW